MREEKRGGLRNLQIQTRSAVAGALFSLYWLGLVATPARLGSAAERQHSEAGQPDTPAVSAATAPAVSTPESDSSEPEPSTAAATPPEGSAGQGSTETDKRTDLNLLGRTDVSGGESRRNENVQFNLIDNNALKELNIRLGTTATIIEEFQADRSYFGAEFGSPPAGPLHVTEALTSGLHGRLWEAHQNSLFSARSFFQVGDVKPARDPTAGNVITAIASCFVYCRTAALGLEPWPE